MKKILVLILFLVPAMVFGQKVFVRNTITNDTIYFYRGLTLLNLAKDATKLNKNNPVVTGTLTTPILKVGNAASNTITSLDSISHVTGSTDINFFDGPDTLYNPPPYNRRIDLYDAMDTSAVIATKYDLDTMTVGGGGLTSGQVAAQINDTIEARLAVAVPGLRIADTASMLSKYPRKLNAVLTGVPTAPTATVGTNTTQIATTAFVKAVADLKLAISDTANMLLHYPTLREMRRSDSDTIPLFIFGTGSGAAADTALFNNNRYAGAFQNTKSDTLHITAINGVLATGTGTETISVQVSWDVNFLDGTPTNLNSSALAITSQTTGTNDTSFNANDIPPGDWVWCTLSGASKDNKPTMLVLTMTGYKRNRKY